MHNSPGIARVGKVKVKLFFPGFWPNLGPGRRPLDSDRRDAEFAGVFASVAFCAVSFVPKSIFWNPAEKKVKTYVQARPDFTSIPLRLHFDVTSVSLRSHFDFTLISLRIQFDFTLISL